jgi:hypothetical protein
MTRFFVEYDIVGKAELKFHRSVCVGLASMAIL